MADRYWVGGTATWDATAGSKWATVSGGAGGAATPTASDDVYFDNSSGSGTVSVGAGRVGRSMDLTGFTGTFTPTGGIAIGGSGERADHVGVKFGSTMIYSPSGSYSYTFASTNATSQTWDFGTYTLIGAVTFTISGAGGTVKLVSNMTFATNAASITLTNGTFDVNGNTVTLPGTGGPNFIVANNSNNRTFALGSGVLNIANITTPWSQGATLTNFSMTGTGTINITGAAATVATSGATLSGTSITWVLSGSGAQTITGAGTFYNLTRTGTAAATDILSIAAALTISNAFVVTGNDSAANRLMVRSSSFGTARTITVNGSITSTNANWRDITAAGSASWDLSAASGGSGDAQGNTSITFTSPTTQTWAGGTGNWGDVSKWTSRVPLPQDTALISSGSGTITPNCAQLAKDIDFTGFTGVFGAKSLASNIYGSLTLGSGMTVTTDTTNIVSFLGRSSHTITTNNVNWQQLITLNALSGTYTFADNFAHQLGAGTWILASGTANFGANRLTGLSSGGNITFTVSGGTLTFSTGGITGSSFSIASGATVNMGSGTWHFNRNATSAGTVTFTAGATVNAGTSSLVFDTAGSSVYTFNGGGFTFNNITITDRPVTITGANTFSTFAFTVVTTRTLILPASTTTTVTASFTVNGLLGNLAVIQSSSAGTAATLACAIGVSMDVQLASIKDNTGSGGARFSAYNDSVDVSGNTNWKFNETFGWGMVGV